MKNEQVCQSGKQQLLIFPSQRKQKTQDKEKAMEKILSALTIYIFILQYK